MTCDNAMEPKLRYRIDLTQDYRGWFATIVTYTAQGEKLGWTQTKGSWSEAMEQAEQFIAKTRDIEADKAMEGTSGKT